MANAKKALLEGASARVAEIDAALLVLERRVATLKEERDELNRLRDRYGAPGAKKMLHFVGGDTRIPKPSEAVLALVTREPGLKVTEIVDKLETQIATNSKNRRRLLSSTVDVLARRRKKLRKDEDGRVYLATA